MSQKTKEQIIDSVFTRYRSGLTDHISIGQVYSAMDEYAEQESIAFGEWIGDNYETYDKGFYLSNDEADKKPYTIPELYQLFKQSNL